MKNSIVEKSQIDAEDGQVNGVRHMLEIIGKKLDNEVSARQKTIDLQEQEIVQLRKLLEEKNKLILQLNDKLAECTANNEGSRQLINKLLNDIERMNHDIEWYKRTYENRSLLGTIRQKLFG